MAKINRVNKLSLNDFIKIFRQQGASNVEDLLAPVEDFIALALSQIDTTGSGLLLLTEGEENPNQERLNFVAGSENITIEVDEEGNLVFTVSGGSGGTYTVDNGLTEDPSGNFQLGSTSAPGAPLLHNTFVDLVTFFMRYTGSAALYTHFYVNTGSGGCISATATSGVAVAGTVTTGTGLSGKATSGVGVRGASNTDVGIYGASGSGVPGVFSNDYSVVRDDIRTGIRVVRNTSGSGTALAGAGISIDFHATNGAVTKMGDWLMYLLDATLGAEDVAAVLRVLNNGVLESKIAVRNDGLVSLLDYGTGTFTGTLAYALGVDVSGNIIEFTPSGGGGSGTVTSVGLVLNPVPSTPAIQINNSPITTSGDLEIEFLGTSGQFVKADGSIGTIIPDIAVYPYIQNFYLGSANPLDLLVVGAIDRLYIPSNTSGEIRVYVASTGALVATIALASVAGVFYINSELWATNIVNGTISRYNATTGALLGTVTGSGIRGVDAIYFPSTNKAMFANFGSNNVTFIDTTTNTVTTTIASAALGGNGVNGLALATAGAHSGLVSAVLRTVSEICLIDPVTEAVVTAGVNPSSSLTEPIKITYNASIDRYFITNLTNQNVVVLNPDSGTTYALDSVIPNIQRGFGIVNDSTNNLIYVAGGNLEGTTSGQLVIYTIDAATRTVIKITPTSLHNTTTTLVNNISIDSVNGFIYCNTYGGTAGASLTAKLKLRP